MIAISLKALNPQFIRCSCHWGLISIPPTCPQLLWTWTHNRTWNSAHSTSFYSVWWNYVYVMNTSFFFFFNGLHCIFRDCFPLLSVLPKPINLHITSYTELLDIYVCQTCDNYIGPHAGTTHKTNLWHPWVIEEKLWDSFSHTFNFLLSKTFFYESCRLTDMLPFFTGTKKQQKKPTNWLNNCDSFIWIQRCVLTTMALLWC